MKNYIYKFRGPIIMCAALVASLTIIFSDEPFIKPSIRTLIIEIICFVIIAFAAIITENQIAQEKVKEVPTPEEKPKLKFVIEHYPITNRYAATHNGLYLKSSFNTGIISLTEHFFAAALVHSEIEAQKLIERYKEQVHKENVNYIYYE